MDEAPAHCNSGKQDVCPGIQEKAGPVDTIALYPVRSENPQGTPEIALSVTGRQRKKPGSVYL